MDNACSTSSISFSVKFAFFAFSAINLLFINFLR